GLGVVKLPAIDQDSDLAAGLDRVCLIDAREAQSKRFELFQASDVFLESFAPRTRAAGTDRVGGGNQHCIRRLDAQVIVMPQRRMDHLLRLAVASSQLGSDKGMTTFHLVVGRLADVVQKSTPPAEC